MTRARRTGWLIVSMALVLMGPARGDEPSAEAEGARLAVSLIDGSRLVAEADTPTLPLKTAYAEVDLPLNRVRRIEVDDARGAASIFFRNEDRLTGRLTTESMTVETVLGTLELRTAHLVAIDVLPGGRHDAIPQDGLILHFGFEKKDNLASDRSGHGWHGRNRGATLVENGKIGGAAGFDGRSAAIELTAQKAKALPTGENFAVSVWFLNDGKGNQGRGYGQKIIDKTTMFHDFYISVGTKNGGVRFRSHEGRGKGGLNDTSRDYRDGQWHHVVAVKEGRRGELWVDGELRSEREDLTPVRNDTPLLLGYSRSSDGLQRQYWSGALDELLLYDRALTAAEIRRLARSSNSGSAP